MKLRPFKESDSLEMAELFYNTVHHVNARDYTKAQLDAWAHKDRDLDQWKRSFCGHDSLVAVETDSDGNKEIIVGFGDMDETGYLDRLYVHKDFQGRGIARAICDKLEEEYFKRTGKEQFSVHASITARPFFEKRGYQVVKEQQVERKGELLTNFVMVKEKTDSSGEK